MSRINTNVSSLIAVNVLNGNQSALKTSLQRLSTGYRINSGKDDPAGLIASENLRAEQKATQTAISNAQRADNIIGTAEGALSEVSNLLVSLQSLVVNTANKAGLSQEEKDANQLQVDSILSTVNRISNSASFEGVKLLNGTFDYTTSGVAASALSTVQINSANIPQGGSVNVVVQVTTSAQTGQLNFLGSSTGLTSASTLSVTGNTGTTQVSFSAGTKSSAIVAGINQFTDSTGVKAVLSSDSKSVKILSTSFGSTQFVKVDATVTSFSNLLKNPAGSVTDSNYGRNATLKINGATAVSDGLSVRAVSSNLDVSLTLNTAFNSNNLSKTFAITGGGATFALGAQVNSQNLASIGIGTVDTSHLGNTQDASGNSVSLANLGSGQSAALNTGDTTLAQKIVNTAIKSLSSLRGRLGAFQANVLASTVNSLNVALENVSSSESAIRDTDFATETSNLTRSQILVQSATSVLQQANSAPQSVLKLLG